ncbi:hypothetical protein [Halosimplex pelagicum]|uniref:Uncharacterized protein n=1 Tax=Halosimplex pelagicum TaxID=869886 RepID=A0A7D5PD35_9EURY|nr:hypothetical protein [Halosimplex pelagicum]QLH83762.1 hypothetical protein HZS54_19955 [Halosimplex pelagicum]
MTVGQQSLTKLLYGEIKELFVYHIEEVKTILWQMFAIFVCSGVLAYAWYIGWITGNAYDLFNILSIMLPVNEATLFTIPAGFLFGLFGLFVLDDYKRLQGLFLFASGLIGIATIVVFVDALQGYSWFTVETIGTGLLAFVFGMLYGGLIEELRTDGLNVFDEGLERFRSLVFIVGIWAIAEALIDENLIWTAGDVPTVVAGIAIPAKFPGKIIGLEFDPIVSLVAFVVFMGALLWLLELLGKFGDHDLDKSVLILGPDRAGKTWFMGGTAYCLMDQAIQGNQTVDPDPNDPLDDIRSAFAQDDFDNELLEPNEGSEHDFFRFQFRHGLIKRQRVTVKTVDYPGEHLKQIETDIDDAWDTFLDKWDDYEDRKVPTFEELREKDRQNGIDPDQMTSLLSILAMDADTLGLVLPMDEFAEELDDNELPEYLDQSDLESRRQSRAVPRRTNSNETGNGFFEVYKELCDDKDFFFLATMSDTFLQTYSMYEGKFPKTSWDDFREHIWGYVQDLSKRDQFEPGVNLDMERHKYIYPVYFEPDKSNPRTQDGELKPKLDWDDDHYALRGLQYVLERIGR